ncbi:glycosyltransferase [Streptomyces flavidovirens]
MTVQQVLPAAEDWRGCRVVVCNWRDGRHPEAGGAELYCEQVARYLHNAGVQVTYLTARPPKSARREQTTYGSVVRGGGRYSVYLFVLWWLLVHRRHIDAIIDSQNGIPFFTPLVVRRRTPVILLIHHVHQQQFTAHFPAPVAALGRWLEGTGCRLVYRGRAICAVSPSTRAHIRTDLRLRGPIYLTPPGLEVHHTYRPRAYRPRIVSVGRLTRHKRVDHLIRAMLRVRRATPDAELHLVGDGQARPALQRLAARLNLGDAVFFHGRLPTPERDALISSAWLTASASPREGWGLSVIEAAGAGVPAVTYDVPGLRDIIRHGQTGWLVPDNETDLADGLALALHTVHDPERAALLDVACRAWAGRFTWHATTAHLLAALTEEHNRLNDRAGHHPPRPLTDACTVVTLPQSMLRHVDASALRPTDQVHSAYPDASLLLVRCDEHDARQILTRTGLNVADPRIRIRLARHDDLLGRQQHPSARRTPAAPTPKPSSTRRCNSLLAGVFGLALLTRLIALDTSYEIFVDELYYVTISRSLAAGDGPLFDGTYFALHPPALFTLLAGVLHALPHQEDLLATVYALRPAIAVTGAVLATTITSLLRRAVSTPIAAAAGVLLALDPFLNRFDSRVMLETQACAATALGMLALAHTPATARARAATALTAGLFFALAITTKELYSLISLLPLIVLALTARGPVRRMRWAAVAVTTAGYGLYVAVTAATGAWPAWRAQKLDGLARAAGWKQITGFNDPDTGVTLSERLLANLGHFAVSYTLIALGTAATWWLLWHRLRHPLLAASPARQVITAWSACTVVFLAYAVVFGTLEEQMFYPLLVTSTAALALTADHLLSPSRFHRSPRPGHPSSTVAAGSLLALALVFNAAVWVQIHTRQDDAYRRTIAWTSTHLPADAVIAVTDETPAFLLPSSRLQPWTTPKELAQHQVTHLLLSTRLVSEGYARLSPPLHTLLAHRAPLVHSEHGPTTGVLRLYDARALLTGQQPPGR